MNGENQLLLTYEPVEFDKHPIQIQDFRKITHPFQGIYVILLSLTRKSQKDVDM